MPKYVDVVILMQQNFSILDNLDGQVTVLAGSLDGIKSVKPIVPFATEVVEWLNALSGSLLKDPQAKQFPDVITFAFFCRKANLIKLQKQYDSDVLRLGRGIIFHIAPSNVPVNFAYSFVAGLLAGNANIVRVSQKDFPQVDIIVKHINQIADTANMSSRLLVLRYQHESNANEIFSALCDVRVIWGGDETIAKIRRNPLKPRAFDICFADRYSLAAINADEMVNLKRQELQKLIEGFYNDTYLFDQNACSAPHLVVWTGNNENVEVARQLFWAALYDVVKKKYQFQEKMAVDKLTALYRQAVAMSAISQNDKDNLLCRVEIQSLPQDIDTYRCSCGYFTEYVAKNLDEIAKIVSEKYQTLAYFGYDKEILSNFVVANQLVGIDRIVPIGKTTDFSLTWDGINLIERMSRIVDIQ